MAIFTISDLHLSFAADKPMNIFGGAWKNHEEEIRADWISQVRQEDFVCPEIIPGRSMRRKPPPISGLSTSCPGRKYY